MTSQEILQQIVSSNAVFQRLAMLQARWRDEHEYEDIAEYARALQPIMPEGVTVVRMNKSPFVAVLEIGGSRYKLSTKRVRGGYTLVARAA